MKKVIKFFAVVILLSSLVSCTGCSQSAREAQLKKVTPEFLNLVEKYPQFNLEKEGETFRLVINEQSFSFQKTRRGEYSAYIVDSISSHELGSRQTGVLVEQIRGQISEIEQQKKKQINEAFEKTWK